MGATVALTGCPADDDGQAGAEGSGGADPSFEAFTQRCVSQTDRDGCEDVDGFEGDAADEPQFGFCVWETSVPVELGDDGSCAFGEPSGRCIVETGSTVGCASPGVTCDAFEAPGAFGGVRDGEDGPVLVEGDVCIGHADAIACFVNEEGALLDDGPPECACLCDAAYPG